MIYLAQQYFDNQAKSNSKKIALSFGGEKISYGQLYSSANKLASLLRHSGVKRGDRVCLCLPKSINSIKSILATLKADAVYVPLDAFSPFGRLRKIIKDCDPAFLLCDDS